jgi:hypothetical protein
MAPTTPAIDVKSLHAKISELTLENDFLEGALTKAGLLSASDDRPRARSTDHKANGSFADQPRQRLLYLDRLHLEFPFAGSRMLRGLLTGGGARLARMSKR